MKILHTEASLGWGGQEIRIFREAVGMRGRNYDVIIAAHPDSKLLENAKGNGLKTISIEFRRRNFLKMLQFFKKLIEGESIDIVNTHSSKDSWLVLPAARLAENKPLILRTRHLSTPIGRNFLSKFLYTRLPHFIITTGEAIMHQMIEKNHFNPQKIVSIPTGVDTETFNPWASGILRNELNIPPSAPLIGTVSVIRSWKGLDFFVRAVPLILKAYPDTRFVITGDGPYRKKLTGTIQEAGIDKKIYMLGHRNDVVSVLASLDVLIHPSYANEGVPQTILQAMAMGKPVAASDIAPLREVVIDRETGILFQAKSPEGIAKAVIDLLEDKELSKRIAENGRRLVEKSYSYVGMLNRLESLYAKRQQG